VSLCLGYPKQHQYKGSLMAIGPQFVSAHFGQPMVQICTQIVMSPYEFTSKTHSLSTEDLGKFFIHSFIYLSTPQELFTIHRKTAIK
jgi:hypothetical protein